MAFQQASNKGTLVPGQTISVNKFTVQVERYLSQGGFAHVYLVRTPTPVYGTTHHVLKRIAVASESMLTDVKKEVDIMRILKGHPNVVHLIDAAWHRTSAGAYEVFILMEFCPGGGIIDMMNRRLRERLTEADILQIFVDVCEGVAAMHNLRPALLHRDLKVENILQSSDTLFKLCDFGSATPVARLPANTQEIRALEADLNRHTTLQYRAPEMVDPYLRRPIDEKSDVWALGVLLYKLCYYTTPFEEHGPLAILNVQYKIPPYPAYSAQMNSLIGSMLREHGAQRPTVFETLNVVHRMRGTKSKFTYDVPSRSQLTPHLPTEPSLSSSATLDGLVSYRSSTSASQAQAPPSSTKPDKNAGVQAREKVLEALAPLRRGRPAPVSLHHSTTGPSSPTKEKAERKPFELEFNEAEDESWKAARGAVRGHRSGLVSPTTWPPPAASIDDAWGVARGSGTDTPDKSKNRDRRKTVQGPIAGLSGFGDSFDSDLALSSTAAAVASASGSPWLAPQVNVKSVGTSLRPQETTSRFLAPSKPRDAFEGLGLSSDRAPAPTLGEVQKARTGLSVGATGADASSTKLAVPGRGTSTYQASSSSPRPSPSPRLSSQAPSPAPPASTSWRPSPSSLPQSQTQSKVDLTAEQRFPALEVLDRTFSSSASSLLPSQEKLPTLPPQPSYSTFTGATGQRLGSKFTQTFSRDSSTRSEQTTGVTAPEPRDVRPSKHERAGSQLPPPSPSRLPRLPSRAPPPKRQTSLAVRPPPTTQEPKPDEPPSPAKIIGRRPEPQDWLTGPEEVTGARLVLRDLPKRSSVVVERAPRVPSPQEAVAVSETRAPPSPSPAPASTATPSWNMGVKQIHADTGKGRFPLPSKPVLASVEPRGSAPAPVDSWSPAHRRRDTTSTTSSDDGPEDATAFGPPQLPTTRQPVRAEAKVAGDAGANRRRRSKSKGRQGSVHELVDLWGGKDVQAKSSGGGGLSPGPKPASRDPEDIASSGRTLLFPPVDQPPKSRSASPQPLISPSISTDSTKREQPSPTRRSPRHRKQSTNGRDAGPPPSASAGTATVRPRPQSMFLNSPTAAAVKFPVPSPVDSSSPSLGVPAPDARAQRTTRRTSITDMVQRYEAMGGSAAAAGTPTAVLQPSTSSPAPPPPLGASLTRTATTHVSPTPRRGYFGGAVGLPGLSVDLSPSKKLPTGLGVSDRPRAEHASPVGLPGLTVERKPSASYGSGRRSPTKIDSTGGLDVPARPVPKRSPSPAPPVAGDEAQPSSPERPYHGVGRLIDQWQRKTADVDPPRSPVSRRRGGAVAGTSATASPRRAGVIAGRGTQD
ncbi:hypothetical protein EDB85DRAFT_1908507 [Lactarius pseudohatsudake]|nr:hypothetical protein EDB85DRAFT_1908507 [Lactarius pseudohatsudake]